MYRIFFLKMERFLIKIRSFHYRKMFGSFGRHSQIFGGLTVYYSSNVMIGDYSSINEGVVLNGRAKISIGDHVHISPHVIINTGTLEYSKIGINRIHVANPVIIGDGVWLGSGVIVNPGVTIGENSVIGAGAVVTKNIPPNCLAVGIPARVVKEI